MKKKEEISKSKKPGGDLLLSGYTQIFQSNRITNSKFEKLGLLHAKLFITVIKHLQEAVKFSMSGGNWQQLDLFNRTKTHNGNSEYLYVPITLSEIAKPNRYADFFEAARELRLVTVKIKSALGGNYVSYTGLINSVEEPTRINNRSVLYLQIHKQIAQLLIQIDKNKNNEPVFYTKYLYEVALNGTNKYTWKLYMIISSWKSKGFYKCTLPELKEQLGILPGDYPSYSDFKRRVLLPVQQDLENKSDCWFNCNEPGFEIRRNRKIILLVFKIITPELEKDLQDKAGYIKHLLKDYYKCNDSHIKQLQPIFDHLTLSMFEAIIHKLISLRGHFEKVSHTQNSVFDMAAYTVASLLETFTL